MSENKNFYKVNTIATLLNITERRVQQLAKEGIIPKAQKGSYDLVQSVNGYIKYLQNQLNNNSEFKDLKFEKTRLIKFQADKSQIELKLIQGNAILITDIETEISNMILTVRTKLLTIPNKLAPLLINETDLAIVENIIKTNIYEILEELSKVRVIKSSKETINTIINKV